MMIIDTKRNRIRMHKHSMMSKELTTIWGMPSQNSYMTSMESLVLLCMKNIGKSLICYKKSFLLSNRCKKFRRIRNSRSIRESASTKFWGKQIIFWKNRWRTMLEISFKNHSQWIWELAPSLFAIITENSILQIKHSKSLNFWSLRTLGFNSTQWLPGPTKKERELMSLNWTSVQIMTWIKD